MVEFHTEPTHEPTPYQYAIKNPAPIETTQARPVEPAPKKSRMSIAVFLIGMMVLGTFSGLSFQVANRYLSEPVVQGAYYLDASQIEKVTNVSTEARTIQDIVKELDPAIVAITSRTTISSPFFNAYEAEGSGTGVVFNVSSDAVLIVTNHHVVENAESLMVSFDDANMVKAEIVGVDPDADIAVIKVAKADLDQENIAPIRVAVFGDSDKLVVGEPAIAIGNPLGYDDTVTAGVISAIDRQLELNSRTFSLIQTDAAINPGNSGGALVNQRGEVIGINTIKISDTKVEGIGFAIPINTVKPIIEELLEKGYVSRPYLGISGRDINEEIAQLYNLPKGIMVGEVLANSGASTAGLKQGDIITQIDQLDDLDMQKLIAYIASKKVGDQVTLTIVRDQKTTLTIQAKLSEKKPQ